jgi:protein-disulfide isomerase
LSETHQQAIEVATKVAEEKGMKVKIFNTSSRMGKLRAKLKRVKHTPTIIVGDGRITGNVTKEKLLSLLKPLYQ